VHALTAQKPDVAPYKINMRLFIPKLLFIPAFAFALVSQHTYAEDGFWDTTWEVLSFLILTIAALAAFGPPPISRDGKITSWSSTVRIR